MDEGKETFWELVIGIVLFMIFSSAAGALLVQRKLAFVLGDILGAGVALILVNHMYKTIEVAVELPEKASVSYTRKKAMLRLLVMGLAVVTALTFPEIFHTIGVVVGILGLKVSAFIQPLTKKYIFTKIYNRGR